MIFIFPVEGVDFVSLNSLTFNFEVGTATQACINITIIDDVDLEGDHTFDVILGTSTPALGGGMGGFGFPRSTTITIEDSEGMLVIMASFCMIAACDLLMMSLKFCTKFTVAVIHN